MSFNPYKVLSVDPGADVDVISAAYRTLSKKFHPDVNKSPDAESRMREINRAYEMLKDPQQRQKVDADLSRSQASTGANAGTGPGSGGFRPNPGYVPPRPAPNRSRTPGPNIADQVGDALRRAGGIFNQDRPATTSASGQTIHPPDDRTLYFYQKQLADETQRKSVKVSVYHDGATNRKLCNIRVSAPNSRDIVTSGEVYLDSSGLFDLTLAMSEAERMLTEPSQPIESNADHEVYYRQVVHGLGQTYIGIEVIKRVHGTSKEALLLLGEKNARAEKDGVVSNQSSTRLQQVGRIFKSALEAMR